MLIHLKRVSLLSIVLTMAAGCVSLHAPVDSTRHYLLNGADSEQDPMASGPVIFLSTIELDPYLDTPYMVLRVQKYEIQFSDIHRWGEDLSDNIRRALAKDLLATGTVSGVVTTASDESDYKLSVQVHRFEGVPPDIAHLAVTWRLFDSQGRLLHAARHSDRNRGWQFENYGHLAAKLDESLVNLADAISQRLLAQ